MKQLLPLALGRRALKSINGEFIFGGRTAFENSIVEVRQDLIYKTYMDAIAHVLYLKNGVYSFYLSAADFPLAMPRRTSFATLLNFCYSNLVKIRRPDYFQ